MKITDYLNPKVRIIENFVSEEYCNNIIDFTLSNDLWSLENYKPGGMPEDSLEHKGWLNYAAQWDNRRINFHTLYLNQSHPELFKKIWDVKIKAKEQVVDFFNIADNSFELENWEAVRWYYPHMQAAHIDYIDDDFKRSDFPPEADISWFKPEVEEIYRKQCQTKHYTAMLYLNSDFEGGELHFPYNNKFEIKPKAGMMVIFSGDVNAMHGIKQITSGNRYVNTMFWTKTPGPSWPAGWDEHTGNVNKFW